MKFRHTNFMRLIYATLLALPFVAILSRVIYVQSNKNAYQSYSQEYYKKDIDINMNYISDMIPNGFYRPIVESTQTPSYQSHLIGFSTFSFTTNKPNLVNAKYFTLGYSTGHSGSYCISFYDEDKNYINLYALTTQQYFDEVNKSYFIFTDYDSTTISGSVNYIPHGYLIDERIITTQGKLDNVFEYSVNKFIENNNFGKINLFQWTTDLFFDNNDVNNMYVGFINWYLNYTLLVSATYILFLVLMWFINYARRLLERGMNYDF